ncbi:FG-GAP-like repeat-containing protein [Chitinophaga sp. MM2321]|uniref:FG-GAP-like repeat-containing protein n=1 Tax=Chitinophaga sp. MM2321 TaxID=3137178 RepID=UPI0032D5A145
MKIFIFCTLLLGASLLASGQSANGDMNGKGLSFIPDYTFKGSALTGWKQLGNADWHVKNGELTGTAKQKTSEGLLMFDQSFQDIGINTFIKITGDCEAGILFRAEKNGDGMKAVLVSISRDSSAAYSVTINAQGKVLSREKLRPAGGMIRIAPPLDPANPVRTGGYPAARGNQPALPNVRPQTAFVPGEWNQLEFIFDMNLLRGYINDGSGPGGGADDVTFGPVGLYVKGSGEVRFKDFKYKDLAVRYLPEEQTSARFRVQQISDMYYSWSAASADFNNDGIQDIVAGPYIYYGPDYTKYREIYPGIALSPTKDFTEVNCQYAFDFNGDGWTDVFIGPPFGRLYMNPKGESRRWDVYDVIPGNINSEVTLFTDIDGDNKPELVYGTNSAGTGVLKYAKFNPADPTKPWNTYTVSESGYFMAHGIGAGDINGDGRIDILNPNGWWEQPEHLSDAGWTYHPAPFGRYGHRVGGIGGSVMAVYDVNGDKLNDVVTSLNAHGFGLAWYEQKRDAQGKISFIRHMIMDDYSTKNAGDVTFSELHGSTLADVDGDGITDFIVGKRYFSHLDTYLDPDPFGPPLLYWYRTVRNPAAPGGAEFIPELIHNRSGAGSDLHAADLNNDGLIDIISSTNRGTFIFWNKQTKK